MRVFPGGYQFDESRINQLVSDTADHASELSALRESVASMGASVKGVSRKGYRIEADPITWAGDQGTRGYGGA